MKTLACLGLVGLALGCGDTTDTTVTQLNLDRPVDIAFACHGGLRLTGGQPATLEQEVIVSAQPTSSCDTRALAHDSGDPAPTPAGQEDLEGSVVPTVSYYGFALQSLRGTVALVQWDPKPATAFVGGDVLVLDADPLTPGKNSISVGEDPIAIATDHTGCKVVTANAGSCDLSILDVATAVDDVTGVTVDRLAVTSATGLPVRARPAAMVAAPQTSVIGAACPATATGIVYIAYPSCQLVAAVDVSTGVVVAGLHYAADGTVTIGDGAVSCPDECGGGGTLVVGPRPVALDLELDPRIGTMRLAIGADNVAAIAIVELGDDALPEALRSIPLADPDGALGVTALAISPQIGMGGTLGVLNDTSAPGGQAQFVYAITTDQTIRVAEILTLDRECDTQVDPRFVREIRNVREVSCFPVGDAATPRRRAGARGPGIELLGGSIPTSVEIFRGDPVDGDTRATPIRSVGYFAIVTAANGVVFVVNVDDDNFEDLMSSTNPLSTPIPMTIAHQLRDALPERGLLAEEAGALICSTDGPDPDDLDGNRGGPRAATLPYRIEFDIETFAAEKIETLPDLRHVTCVDEANATQAPISELGFAAPIAVRDVAFPDLAALRGDETWTLTWEGSLSNDLDTAAIDGPAIRVGLLEIDARGMRLTDPTASFCAAGVEPADLVQLRGCDPALGDADCRLGYTCYVHPASEVTGLGACMLADEADRLADACEGFLTSLRRYTVGTAANGTLELRPRKHVLRTTPLAGCVDDAQCEALADHAATFASTANPRDDETAPDPATYRCAADPDRPAIATGKRCLMSCTTTADCTAGTVCDQGFCMEGVIPPQACVNAPQRFDLRAHEAFTVLGTSSGYVHPIIAAADGACVRNPAASPLSIGRLPLDAPACDPATDPLTGQRPDGTDDVNPCRLTVTETEYQPRYVADSCDLQNPASELVERPAPAIRFRNRGMTFTLVDPTYPGDAACIGDRRGAWVGVPAVFGGYQLEFRQTAGRVPRTLSISPTYPIKVVRGPDQSVWVIDHGDYLSTDTTVASTRGKVYRVEASLLDTANVLE